MTESVSAHAEAAVGTGAAGGQPEDMTIDQPEPGDVVDPADDSDAPDSPKNDPIPEDAQ